ncbi:MAG: hypothetical protein ABUL73_02575 [Alphaproteobacteria bacterium]
MKKITVEVPVETLDAVLQDGGSLTEAVREALKAYAQRKAYERLLSLQGKVKVDINLDALRKDKNEE